MYVCLCHGLTDRKVREANTQGASTPAKVFKHHGVKPQCGKCVCCMREVLSEGPSVGTPNSDRAA